MRACGMWGCGGVGMGVGECGVHVLAIVLDVLYT